MNKKLFLVEISLIEANLFVFIEIVNQMATITLYVNEI